MPYAYSFLARGGEEVMNDAEKVSWFLMVRIPDINAYLAQGWLSDGLWPLPGSHGQWSVMLTWPGPGEPPEPPVARVEER